VKKYFNLFDLSQKLVTSIFGGRPGMISAATGAVAVVILANADTSIEVNVLEDPRYKVAVDMGYLESEWVPCRN